MNKKLILVATALLAIAYASPPVFAQSEPSADVKVGLTATMPNLRDNKLQNTFIGSLLDSQVRETVNLKCTAGHSKWAILHENKVCGFQGGSNAEISVKGTWYPRLLIGGGYEVTQTGSTDATSITYGYQPVGGVGQSNATFTGELLLKPELASGGAKGLVDDVLAGLTSKAGGGVINRETDTITFNNFCVPSAGFPSDKGTCFNGDAVYSYQQFSWYFRLTAKHKDVSYQLEGNMPFTTPAVAENVDPNKPAVTEYNVTLSDPKALPATSTVDEDEALFAEFDPDSAFGQLPTGITGKLTMKNSSYVDVQIGQETLPVASNVQLDGTLHGNGVPLPVVRSFAKLIVEILPETFVGP